MQSRYYNPDWGRFINADAIAGSVGELLGHNIFAYCKNNPVSNFDPDGFRTLRSDFNETDYEDESDSSESFLSSVFDTIKEVQEQVVQTNRMIIVGGILALGKMELDNSLSKIKLPKVVKSAKGVEGDFSVKGYEYRIDTNKIAPGEGGFHIHIFRDGDEIAKVNGRGGFVQSHKGETLLKPSELNKTVRNELNKLISYIQKNLGGD